MSALIVTQPGVLRHGLVVFLGAIPQIGHIYQANDAAAALPAVVRWRPRLVLLDAGLPGAEITALLRQIKAREPRSCCVVLVDDIQQQQMLRSAGADVALPKGFSVVRLFEIVQESLTEKLERNSNG